MNNLEFIERLKTLLAREGLSAAAFSERIGVQRSSVSHILSNRNKPSLDFVLKIHAAFEELSLSWLLYGKDGDAINEGNGNHNSVKNTERKQPELFSNPRPAASPTPSPPLKQSIPSGPEPSDIESIVVFYKDGTFQSYSPKSS